MSEVSSAGSGSVRTRIDSAARRGKTSSCEAVPFLRISNAEALKGASEKIRNFGVVMVAVVSARDSFWRDEAQRAFEWFLGRNDLDEPLYNPSSGGCYDGLHFDRVNLNQGAESTLAFLLALAEMQTLQSPAAGLAAVSGMP